VEEQILGKAKGTSKSEFIRSALNKDADLHLKQINDR
jgi:hypothetical protein